MSDVHDKPLDNLAIPPLAATFWEFGRTDGSVIAVLTLGADGAISGSNSFAEDHWRIMDGKLYFYAKDGRPTTCFDEIAIERGRHVLSGPFLLKPGLLHHRLRELGRNVDWAGMQARIPEIFSYNPAELRIRTSPRVVQALKNLRLYSGRMENRFLPTDVLSFPMNGELEPYACVAAGHIFCSMGAFSYAESPVLLDMRIGRYGSIALDLQIFGPRHPVEWATTSSITYDVHPQTSYRSFIAAWGDLLDDFTPVRPPGLLEPPPLIGHDVWIGQNVQLARGITIGTGAVIAAGAVVTRDVPPYAIVAGVPARTLRYRFSETIIERLLASAWWRFGPDLLKQTDFRQPAAFLDQVAAYQGKAFAPSYITAASLLDAVVAVAASP